MTIEELQKRKKELGYTCSVIAEKSGVPAATVQKIISGKTKSPGYKNLHAIEAVLMEEPGAEKQSPYKNLYKSQENRNNTPRESSPGYNLRPERSSAEQYPDSYPLLPYKRQGEYTAEDRDRLPDNVRTELIDGVLYDIASPLNPHQIVVGELYKLFNECITKSGKECYVFLSPSDVWLTGDNKNILQPDLYVICDFSMLGKNGRTKGAPPLVVEVLSKTTRTKDFLLKGYKYNQAGVKEYWLADPDKRKVYIYDFEKHPDGAERSEYDFDAKVPIALSGGKCSIDFRIVSAALERLGY